MVIGVIQARMASHRLPGKMLYPIGGEPLIARVFQFAASLDLDDIILATSTGSSNDVLCEWARDFGIPVIREDGEDDVFSRFLSATRTGADHIMRISGDSPCLDIGLAQRLIRVSQTSKADYIGYSFGEFPAIMTRYGIFTEIVRSDALIMASAFTDPSYREHVTNVFYRNRQMFSVEYLQAPVDLSMHHFKLSIDTKEDYESVRELWEITRAPNDYRSAIENIDVVRCDNILQEYEWNV